MSSLSSLVESFIKAVRSADPKELQGFINSTLAEPWKQIILTTTEAEVLKARCALPPQTVPAEAVALTAGIDVQKYGFWFVVRAWARDFTSWLIHYGHLASWDDVEDLLFQSAYPVDGDEREHLLPIWRAAVDTGGGDVDTGLTMTEETYDWLRRHGSGHRCRVWGTKGSSTPVKGGIQAGKTWDKTPKGKPLPGGLQIILLDTNVFKDRYHYRLEKAKHEDHMGAYLHSGTGDDYARQILAEEKRRDKHGVEVWERVKRDNHFFDCEIMCMAVADPGWPGGGINLFKKPRPQAPVEIQKKQGPFNPAVKLKSASGGWLGRR